MTDSCSACRFANDFNVFGQRQCRRHAPEVRQVPHYVDTREFIPTWPIVHERDWCGEFEIIGGGKTL